MKKLLLTIMIVACMTTAQAGPVGLSGATTGSLWADLPLAGKLFYILPPIVFMGIIPASQGKIFERYAQVDCNAVSKDEGRGICSHIGPTNCYADDNWYSDACEHFR